MLQAAPTGHDFSNEAMTGRVCLGTRGSKGAELMIREAGSRLISISTVWQQLLVARRAEMNWCRKCWGAYGIWGSGQTTHGAAATGTRVGSCMKGEETIHAGGEGDAVGRHTHLSCMDMDRLRQTLSTDFALSRFSFGCPDSRDPSRSWHARQAKSDTGPRD